MFLKYLRVTTLLAVTLFLCVGCGDSGSNDTPVGMNKDVVQSRPVSSVPSARPAVNRYDWVGVRHNEGLAFVLREFDHKTIPSLPEKIPSAQFNAEIDRQVLAHIYASGEGSSVTLDDVRLVTSHMNNVYHDIDALFATANNLLIHSRSLTPRDKYYTRRVMTLARAALDSGFTSSSLAERINALEREIMEQPWQENECLALAGIAVYRHSAIFWNERMPDIANKEGAVILKTTDKRAKKAAIIAGDFLGAVVGAGIATTAPPPVAAIVIVKAALKGSYAASGAVSFLIGLFE